MQMKLQIIQFKILQFLVIRRLHQRQKLFEIPQVQI
nr:hypothetical protein Q903MT_gene6256 [Picea sitchensis]